MQKTNGLWFTILFLAHLAKGNVSFCHHLASIGRRPLTFHILIFSSETPQPNEPCLLTDRDEMSLFTEDIP
jgi:hypothetical protein